MYNKNRMLAIGFFVFFLHAFLLASSGVTLTNGEESQFLPTFTVTEYNDSIAVENSYTKWVVRDVGAVITGWWIKATGHNQSSDVCPEFDGHRYMLTADYLPVDFRTTPFSRQIIYQMDYVVVVWTATVNSCTLERTMVWQGCNYLKIQERFVNNYIDSLQFACEAIVKVGGDDQNDLVAFKYVGQDSIDTSYTYPFPNDPSGSAGNILEFGSIDWICAYDRIAGEYVAIVPVSDRVGLRFGDCGSQNPEGNDIEILFGYVKPGDSLTVSYYLVAGIGDFNSVCLRGDANGDRIINSADVAFLINYLFIAGPAPNPFQAGDANFDNSINIADVVYLINYLFIGGPPPCSGKLLSSSGNSTTIGKSVKTAKIGFSEVKGSKNSQFELSILGEFNVDVSGLQLEISYDHKEVTLLEPSLTARTQGLQLYSHVKDGLQKIGIIDISGQNHILPGEGPLVTLRAKGSDLSSLVIKEAILVDTDAHTIPVEIVKTMSATKDNSVPQEFCLVQNYPNPFNPSTIIQYTVSSRQKKAADGGQRTVDGSIPTTLKIYNIRGQLVRTLVDEPKTSGTYEVIWDGKDDQGQEVASGVYFYKLKAGDYTETKKMILMK